jgi:hypothetical protein
VAEHGKSESPTTASVRVASVQLPSSHLNQAAADELVTCVQTFADELYAEASRLEAGQNLTGGQPEITSSMVRFASQSLRHGFVGPRRSGWGVILIGGQATATAILGLSMTALDSSEGQIAFALSLGAALFCAVMLWLRWGE